MALFPVLLFLAAMLPPILLEDSGENAEFKALSTTLTEIQEEIVNKHNELRKSVSPKASDMLKMKWSSEAAVNAQKWANQCNYKHSDQEFRRLNISCGENLFMSSNPRPWSQAIQIWYDESREFIFDSGPTPPNAAVGHYTQVVWSTSFLAGCGVAHCPESSLAYFYVCHYCPAGNYVGKLYKPYKEGEPCASCPNDCDDGLCTNSCNYEDSYSNCPDLKETATCEHPIVKSGCKASCNCEGKIY
uniref:Cysteine-rich secretory protein 3-like n=1 Tax=Nannospalax galili TaxID=1026970 RepID=A0A8C6QM14_NANGA